MTAKVSKKNSFSTLSYQVLWLGSGIRPPRTIPLGPTNFVVGGNLEAKRLNRTFYGIETRDEHRCFYLNEGLNRTFYGIETLTDVDTTGAEIVLIVPFMELKRLL